MSSRFSEGLSQKIRVESHRRRYLVLACGLPHMDKIHTLGWAHPHGHGHTTKRGGGERKREMNIQRTGKNFQESSKSLGLACWTISGNCMEAVGASCWRTKHQTGWQELCTQDMVPMGEIFNIVLKMIGGMITFAFYESQSHKSWGTGCRVKVDEGVSLKKTCQESNSSDFGVVAREQRQGTGVQDVLFCFLEFRKFWQWELQDPLIDGAGCWAHKGKELERPQVLLEPLTKAAQ